MLISRKIVGSVAAMLGLPSTLSDFTWAWGELIDYSNQYVCGPDQMIHWMRPHHSYHSIARNELARRAVGEFLLMLDADHFFAPDLLFRLVNAMRKYDADVVTGLYLQRRSPYLPNIWKWTEGGGHVTFGDWPAGEALEVDCAGAGCLLVKTSVYRRIWDELGEEPFSTQEFPGVTGEDFAFFRRLTKLGIRAICPTAIQCHHLEVRPLDADIHFDRNALPTSPVAVRTRQFVAEGAKDE